jgi:hypothetical protein
MNHRYIITRLPSGNVRVEDRTGNSGAGLFTANGSYLSGALSALPYFVRDVIIRTALWS